ncbi:MAG: hypothetical protein U1D30_03515 [Planctomycetota bacterium]
MSSPPVTPLPVNAADSYYKVYEEYSKTIRSWFVGYGIGGPVLIFTNEKLQASIANSGYAKCIAVCFLVGAGSQVLLAVFNKSAMWVLYWCELDECRKSSCRYKIADWFGSQYWMDFLADLTTFGLFGWSTLTLFWIFTG